MRPGITILLFLFLLNLYGGLEVIRVLPNKINYRLREDAIISVTVANRGDNEDSAELFLFHWV